MRAAWALLALLPAVASFGYLALDDDGCSQGHEMLDCMSYQYCGGCYDCANMASCSFCVPFADTPYAPYVDTCAWSEDDGQYIMLTCTWDYDAAGVGVINFYADDDGCSGTPQEISYHVCEEICYGDDDDDDDDDDDCANPTSYGGFYCSYGQIALDEGCSEATCSADPAADCSLSESGQALWDTLALQGTNYGNYWCFDYDGDGYVKFDCSGADMGSDHQPLTQIDYQASDTTCSGVPLYTSSRPLCDGTCDHRRRLRAGQKPGAAARMKRAPARKPIAARVTPRAVEVHVRKNTPE